MNESPPCGLPIDQVRSWLANVRHQADRLRARIEYLQAEQARLHEQESLLMELMASAAASSPRPS